MSATFDQQRNRLKQEQLFDHEATTPNQAFEASIVLEPNVHAGVTRVCVTARDKGMNILWGVNVSEHLLDPDGTTEVAFYSKLRNLIREHLPDSRPQFETTADPYDSIEKSIESIRLCGEAIQKKTTGVKKKSDKTDARATAVANLLLDTLRTWNQELSSLSISKEAGKAESDQ